MRFFLVLISFFFLANQGTTQTINFVQYPVATICGADAGNSIGARAAQGVTGSISSKSVNLKLPATDVILITRTNSANNINLKLMYTIL